MFLIAVLRGPQLRPIKVSSFFSLNAKLRAKQSSAQIFTKRATTLCRTTPVDPKAPPKKFLYPENLCVYHAGIGRVTFLSCLKLSTLFIFAFFGFVVTPAYYDREGWGATTTRTALSAIVPLLFVAYTTSPFVSAIHLRLPPFARQSEDVLRRFVRNLPSQTQLTVTTMSPIAKPRYSSVLLSELKPVSGRMGIVNYARDAKVENANRKWYNFRAVSRFNIQVNKADKAPWAWDEIASTIAKRASV
ncbi:uncharacterized protein BCR38DRAFT_491383 [Pseudomassariella vexata]|uniref:Uncharacterized protein n=1 Tax=Pseudomassariella vexata TaxID=1141098 RepID=A0A1Y2D6D3_9PEZI|nr:uncharacterized protein BCR38DRAFT_491383 [Pseudomassariella vexata]ORY54853.1 hypothetical protein BCR38DRAFT_491383 [Pseudomassariella vexata]